ncbi:MAG TPA: rod shape-determining protein MreD [Bacillota bacterium]|nr:rod shape-determining protein MreD [Bacillota bacterium]
MKHLFIPLILFLLLISEGVALEILPSNIALGNTLIVPHWVFVCLLFIAVMYDKDNTYYSVLYALIFGILIDIVYTGVLGIYMFSYAVVIYVIHGLKKMLHTNIYVILLLSVAGIMMAEIMINTIFSVVGIADMVWYEYTIYRLLPTVLANVIFMLIVYPLFHKWYPKWSSEQLR